MSSTRRTTLPRGSGGVRRRRAALLARAWLQPDGGQDSDARRLSLLRKNAREEASKDSVSDVDGQVESTAGQLFGGVERLHGDGETSCWYNRKIQMFNGNRINKHNPIKGQKT